MNGKILITGSNGQLGTCLKMFLYNNDRYIFTTRDDFDITNYDMMNSFLDKHPDVEAIINCAAYTNVKEAETEEGFKKAMLINCDSVKNLAKICNSRNIFLTHFGTDYMYRKQPYCVPIKENLIEWSMNDEYFNKYYSCLSANDLNKYGYSKLMGVHEIFKEFKYTITDKKPKFIIIVVSWLYSEFGKNFVKTIRERLKKEEKTEVVYNQLGSPTYAIDLAKYIIDVIENDNCEFIKNENNYNISVTCSTNYWHIINFSNLGVASWYDMAKIVEDVFSLDTNLIIPTTKQFDNVYRPPYSVLDTEKLLKIKGNHSYISHWESSLRQCCYMIRSDEIFS